MTTISLDSIVKNILMKRRYPFHYYIYFLVYAKDCLRELTFDNLEIIRYKVLTLNSNNALPMPNDYQDVTGVYVRQGQYLVPLTEDNSLDLVPNYDANFDIQPYSQGIASSTGEANQIVYYNGLLSPYWYLNNWNAFGENLGRQFGGIGAMPDTYRVNKARNEIKINENLANLEYVLEYISNGMDADSATHIDGYAQNCIEAFAMWQFKACNRTYGINEERIAEQSYIKERQILIARLSDLTIERMKRITQINAIPIKY